MHEPAPEELPPTLAPTQRDSDGKGSLPLTGHGDPPSSGSGSMHSETQVLKPSQAPRSNGDSRTQPLGGASSAPSNPHAETMAPTAAQTAAVSVRATVAGYEILGELGRGGMGVVYKARQRGLNRLVPLKMILAGDHAGSEDRTRFRQEAEAVARLDHPNIVQIYDIGESEGRPYFSLEYVDGGSLAGKLNGTPLPFEQAARWAEAFARAMHVAHQHHIVHRDLKPANILLAADGTPKISDFGLAKHLDEDNSQTQSGSVLGTPSYMSPEQAEGRIKEIGPATDVYALGAILYEMLTGRPPFKGATVMDTLEQVIHEEPAPPSRHQPKLDRDLETVCLKALAKDPAKRYASALALAQDLERYLAGEPILARRAGV